MVKDLYCIFSMFDTTVQIQTEDKTIDEKIPLDRAVEIITDFCRSRHIGTAHLMGNASYLDEIKNNILEYSKSEYGHNVVEIKVNE